jgi:DNA-binding transcriptional ArsR family regulator
MATPRHHAARHRTVLKIFDLFGHPVRVTIFQRLAQTPMSAGELAQGLSITRPAVVQHLKRLEAARLVEATSEGRRRIYRTHAAGLAPLSRWLEQHQGG